MRNQDEDTWRDRMDEVRAEYEADKLTRLFRCSDGYCGGLDCARCYGEQAARAFLLKEKQDDCEHSELDDHWCCLECGKDCTDDAVARAEAAADAKEDR